MKASNGAPLSKMGIGAMSFSSFYGPVTRDQVFAILDAARDLGVNHIDTANVYGMGVSESHIGAYFKANPSARNEFHLASKAGITDKSDPERPFNNSKSYLAAELDQSLARLNTDHLDLFYVHRRDQTIPIEEVTAHLADFIKDGKIRAFGYSELSPTSLRAAHAVHPVAALQSEYSLSTRTPELGALQTCQKLGVQFVAFSPVGRSLLSDDPHPRARAETMGFLKNNPRFTEPNLSMNIRAASDFRALAADLGLTAAGLAMAWAVHQGTLPIPGTRDAIRFRDLVKGSKYQLSTDEVSAIDAALPMGWVNGDRYSAAQWIGPERYA